MLEQRRAEAEKTRIENELQRGIKMKLLEKEKEEACINYGLLTKKSHRLLHGSEPLVDLGELDWRPVVVTGLQVAF